MENALSYKETHASRARSQSAPARLEINSREISTLLIERREISAEELELIEMRYRQALAITKLEDLFAEGQLDCA